MTAEHNCIHRILVILTAALLGTPAFAGSTPAREAAAMLRKVQGSTAMRSYPEEYRSFTSTLATAEKMLRQEEEPDRAAQLFSLALLKGEILLERGTVTIPLPVTVAAPVFRQVSSSFTAAPPAPRQQIPASALTPAEEAASADSPPVVRLSARIIGGEGVYVVTKKQSLKLVASRLGVRLRDLARMNQLKPDATVTVGQNLLYNNRRIAPQSLRNGIVVNIPDRNLYLFRNGRVLQNYPVALGISKKGDSTIWRTPTGRFRIVDKQENPAWRIPPSIQKEMEENGEEVVEIVPPGPKNPLGKYAMRTTLAGILIHSTTRPASINSYSSHGCIRVMPEHMEKLFRSVTVPTDGAIIYQPVKVEVTAAGKVFLEVNRDSYEKIEDLSAEVTSVLRKHHATNMVSWQKVHQVINEKSGIAEDVTLPALPD